MSAVETGEVLIDTFKELVWDALMKVALKRLFAKFAFLSWGPIGIIVEYFVMKYADELYEEFKKRMVLDLIAFSNKQDHKKYVEASNRLREAARTHGIDSPTFREMRDADKKALAELIHFDVA